MPGPIRKDGKLDRRYKANRGASDLDSEFVKGADELIAKLAAAEAYIQNDLPTVLGTEAVNHFRESFTNEGFTDTSLQKWAPRRTRRAGGTNSQGILQKTGELADSIDFRIEGNSVVIYTDKKYAQIHNEGGVIQVTEAMKKYFWAQYYMAKESGNTELADSWKAQALAKEIKIPKRQFIGESETLNRRITEKIERDLTRILS